jgi:hypothetical protein
MAKEPKATYRVISVKEGGFAVEVTTKGAISHTEFGFKTEDEPLIWIEAKRASLTVSQLFLPRPSADWSGAARAS